MQREFQILIVAVTASTWLAAALVFGIPTTWWGVVRPFLTAMSVAGATFWLYDKHFWNLPMLHGWLTRQPDLRGVWNVEIRSTYVDPKTNLRIEPVQGYAQIDQTSTSFCLRIYTNESKSKTIAHAFENDQHVYRLAIVYENEPAIELRENISPLHKGSAIFSARGHKPESFAGDYWTERKTNGEIVLRDRRKGEINSFEEGGKIFK